MLKNTSRKIKLILEPDNATNENVYWESRDSNIVTVDNVITVTAKSVGTAYIIASAKENGVSNFIKVTVK